MEWALGLHIYCFHVLSTGYGRLMADGDYWGLMGIYLAAINPQWGLMGIINPHLSPLGINGSKINPH